MNAPAGADVLDVGMVTSVGLRAATTAAAVRAGIDRFCASAFLDRDRRRIVMAQLPVEDLPPLAPGLAGRSGITVRAARMLRLGGAALAEALAREDRVERIPVLLAVPDAHPARDRRSARERPACAAPAGASFLAELAAQADRPFDVARSQVFPNGRAAGFLALAEALFRLRSGAAGRVVVGGVDTHVDADLLDALDAEERVRARGVAEGYIPGEGAAFLLLTTAGARRSGRGAIARVTGAAHALEPGHRYSDEPHRGDGLSSAFARLFDAGAAPAPVETVYAGLNGERMTAMEWGVAHLRHRDRFAEGVCVEHPADCVGDTGAALGPMLGALAALALEGGYRRSPCLVWCSSDRAERGAAIVREA